MISGIGERDVDTAAAAPPEVAKPTRYEPFLLLDVRDGDAYRQCHIIGAQHFPATRLSRATNQYTKEMMVYKNAAGRLIVVYDEDERIAPGVAATLAQRGMDNVFLLSGGLKYLALHFKDGAYRGPAGVCLPLPLTPRHRRPHHGHSAAVVQVAAGQQPQARVWWTQAD